jgi:hypothetical protein
MDQRFNRKLGIKMLFRKSYTPWPYALKCGNCKCSMSMYYVWCLQLYVNVRMPICFVIYDNHHMLNKINVVELKRSLI